jgi:hypothetical protein
METANPYQMFKLPDFDPITFLVARKFPGAPTIAPRHYDEARRRLWEAAQKFRGELEAMPSETFDALLKAEQGLSSREYQTRAEEQERQYIFNSAIASADFDHWTRLPYWSLDEAVALSFGRASEIVSWKVIQPHYGASLFAGRYAKRRQIALRFEALKQLTDPVMPSFFGMGQARGYRRAGCSRARDCGARKSDRRLEDALR